MFKKSLLGMFHVHNTQTLNLAVLRDSINTEHAANPFSQTEITAALDRMTDANQVMLADGTVYLI